MHKIYSRVDNETVICSYVKRADITDYRTDMSDPSEILQGCARSLKKDIYVKPHYHLPIERTITGTQEAWIVLEGKIIAGIHDMDNTKLEDVELSNGDIIILYRGGHSLKAVEDNTIFYELKNGPYHGYENDKKFIE